MPPQVRNRLLRSWWTVPQVELNDKMVIVPAHNIDSITDNTTYTMRRLSRCHTTIKPVEKIVTKQVVKIVEFPQMGQTMEGNCHVLKTVEVSFDPHVEVSGRTERLVPIPVPSVGEADRLAIHIFLFHDFLSNSSPWLRCRQGCLFFALGSRTRGWAAYSVPTSRSWAASCTRRQQVSHQRLDQQGQGCLALLKCFKRDCKRDRPRKGTKDPRYWDAAGNPKKRSLEDTKWGDNSGVVGATR